MTFKSVFTNQKATAVLGGAFVALLGWQLCWLPLGQFLTSLSYDFPFQFSTPTAPAGVVLVELDEISHQELHQNYGERWDRRLHARLLDYLHAAGANLVVFDVLFNESSPDATADAELARAIRAHGRVVLAAGVETAQRPGVVGTRIIPPHDLFRAAANHWGPTQAEFPDADGIVRKIYPGTEQKPALAWIAATLADPALAREADAHWRERWIRYYGPGGTLARVSFSQATNQPAGFFTGKTVFVGGRPATRFVAEEVDEFLTPWRLHGQPQISGLELQATEFLNFTRGDWLHRPARSAETLILVFAGLLAGGLVCCGPKRAVLFAFAGAFLVVAGALVLFFQQDLWFNWAVIVLVQIPGALAWALGWHWWQMKQEKEFLEAPLADLWADPLEVKSNSARPPSNATPPGNEPAPIIPDHELLRQVGRGAYGDVWLARNILGSFQVVKIVRRVAFDHADPYEREFHGLQKFTPISRAHPGLVQVLHVGRVAGEDSFYYVMEAGDDEKTGALIDPGNYTPRNLGRDLRRRAPLPSTECIEIMTALCEALEFLHGRGLIHRDIKPANIIFVNGRPKLADVGLVTEISENRGSVSKVGTEGFLPPEGPGTAAGDIFALGKLLEAMLRAPETGMPAPPDAARERLRSIAAKASALNPAERFPNARAMREVLAAG